VISFICGLWVIIAGYVGIPSDLMEIYRLLLPWRLRWRYLFLADPMNPPPIIIAERTSMLHWILLFWNDLTITQRLFT